MPRSERFSSSHQAQEHFEYTPGILRAFVKPKHLDALSFTLQPVIENRMGCKFVWGEVKTIDGAQKLIKYQPIFAKNQDIYRDLSPLMFHMRDAS